MKNVVLLLSFLLIGSFVHAATNALPTENEAGLMLTDPEEPTEKSTYETVEEQPDCEVIEITCSGCGCDETFYAQYCDNGLYPPLADWVERLCGQACGGTDWGGC